MPRLKPSATEVAERAALAERIGHRIRQIRHQRGMSQADLAGARYTKAYVSAIESAAARPSIAALHYLAERLRVAPDVIIQPGGVEAGETVALPRSITRVRIADGRVYAELHDGSEIGIPLSRSRRLRTASLEQLDEWRVTGYGTVVHWPAIGEEIGLDDFFGTRVLTPDELASIDGAAEGAGRIRSGGPRAGRYDAPTVWLQNHPPDEFVVSMAEIERVIATPLPPSARKFVAPWSSMSSPLAKAIARAGWRAGARVKTGEVRLRPRNAG